MNPHHLLNIWISSTDSYSERRLSTQLTISQLKIKLQPITGIPVQNQRLALNLLPGQSDLINSISLDNDIRTLSDYGIQEGSTIDVIDTDPVSAGKAGQYNDVSQVEKFEISTEQYANRRDTVRAFKERNKLGRFSEQARVESSNSLELVNNDSQHQSGLDHELLQRFPIGARCEVTSLNNNCVSRGTIRFAGPVEFNQKSPFWIGVELDEPNGKNDGSVMGVRYFKCLSSHGTFVLPERVTIGDFPVLDPFEDEEI